MNLFTIVCKNDQKPCRTTFLYFIHQAKSIFREFINVYMKLLVRRPEQIIAACVLLPTVSKNGPRMESFQYISANNNICNANQPINLQWNVHFDLVNRSTNTVFSKSKSSVP